MSRRVRAFLRSRSPGSAISTVYQATKLVRALRLLYALGERAEQTMKAARFSRFGGPEVLEIVDLPDPHPGPEEVRIAVRAAGVGRSDGKKRRGLMDQE